MGAGIEGRRGGEAIMEHGAGAGVGVRPGAEGTEAEEALCEEEGMK